MKYGYKSSFIFLCFTLAVFLLFYTINPTSAQTSLPAEDIAEKALASTVYLEMKDRNGKTLGIGSGFFVKSNIIATNYHVIVGAAKGTAKLADKSTTYNIEGVTAIDKDNDLALLKVTVSGIKPLSLGDSDKVRIGETVYVACNPKGLEGTFSDSTISSRKDKDTKGHLQMTASISPKSNGGSVLNKKGEVIGVSVAVHRTLDSHNLNYAIPSKYLKELLNQSKSTEPFSREKQTVSAETYMLWGNAKSKIGDYTSAISDYYKAIQLQPEDAEAYHNMGLAKFNLEQHFDAIADYDVAIRLKPDYARAYSNRGIVKAQLGRFSDAISDLDAAIRFDRELTSAYYNRGLMYAMLEQFASAISDFNAAIRLDPDFASAYLNRGVVKRKLGKYTAAITDFNVAIRLEPDAADAYLNRGTAKESLRQHVAAISDYNTAIRLKPNYIKAYYNRGVSKVRLGQRSEAKQDFQIVLRLAIKAGDTGFKVSAEKALRKLEE